MSVPPEPCVSAPIAARRIAVTVRGVVQGVGFRPFVYHAARAEGLSGWVRNDAGAVQIEVQGSAAALDRFLETLRTRPPPQARIEAVEVGQIASHPASGPGESFQIRRSGTALAPRPTIPADLATCAECQREIRDPQQRRYRYPFTNCTHCGPRWSIIVALPYDRPRTSLRDFALCADCRGEYEDPADRRFHAQPIACPACGPQLELLDVDGRQRATGGPALEAAVQAVRAGQILALQGLGGFQLLVDATQDAAVARLRTRKRRPHKPLAVLIPTLDDVRRYCHVTADEAAALVSAPAPIVLLRRRRCQTGAGDGIADAVAPGNPYLGVFLPYTPLHHLLADALGRPLVCTSGNRSEEPMAITTADALARLGDIADLLLTHNRPIVRPVDDSVARVTAAGLQILRRARGYAPLPIRLAAPGPTIIAVGGHLKNTVALGMGTDVILSPHIGDLDNALSVAVHRRAIDDLVQFFAVTPDAVVCDLHPDYASTRHAEQLAARWDVPLIRVQHHHGHVAAAMAEHQLDGPVLGLSWDGTGYGPDGTVWGGELLRCAGAGFERLAHLRTFPLPGGDQAAREPRRAALGLLFEVLGDAAAEWVAPWFTPAELRTLLAALRRPRLFPRTSSLGRLFDAVAALCGLPWSADAEDGPDSLCSPARVSFEGQAAMALEFAADPAVPDAYPLPPSEGTPAVADWEPLLRAVIADRRRGRPVAEIAARFHNALADLAVSAARRAGCRQVVLTGGCFQNALLSDRVRERLSDAGHSVYIQQQVPPGDGGLALGQVWVAARTLEGRGAPARAQ